MSHSDLYHAAYGCIGTYRIFCITLGLWPWISSRCFSLPEPLQCRHSPTDTVVTFWKVRCKFEPSRQLCVYRGVQLKSKPQHTENWSAAAWPLYRLCCHPAVFFLDCLLIHLASQHGEKNWTRFYKNVISLFCTMTNKCTIISKIITLLHVSTLSCHPQTACNQYLAKLHKYFKCSCW